MRSLLIVMLLSGLLCMRQGLFILKRSSAELTGEWGHTGANALRWLLGLTGLTLVGASIWLARFQQPGTLMWMFSPEGLATIAVLGQVVACDGSRRLDYTGTKKDWPGLVELAFGFFIVGGMSMMMGLRAVASSSPILTIVLTMFFSAIVGILVSGVIILAFIYLLWPKKSTAEFPDRSKLTAH